MASDERRRRPRVFDVWALPLGNGLYGHLQVLDRHPEFWHLVQVFDAVTPHPLPLADVLAAPMLLPPLFSYVSPKTTHKSAAVWVGNERVEFTYPRFRGAGVAEFLDDPSYADWAIWSYQGGFRHVGGWCEELASIELLTTWPLGSPGVGPIRGSMLPRSLRPDKETYDDQ